MRGERGQASIEWVGAAMLIALTLSTAGRIAGRVDAASVATGLLKAPICAAKGGCHEAAAADSPPANGGSVELVTLPPLVPVAPSLPGPEERRAGGRAGREWPAGRWRPAPPPRAGRGWRRAARRAARLFWRRAWILCFGYERARYGLLHPETGPRQTVPVRGVIQMTNDCASPVDFARDWEHLRPR